MTQQRTIEVPILMGTLTDTIDLVTGPIGIWTLAGTVDIIGIHVIGIKRLRYALNHVFPVCWSCNCFGWS
jgi:hypothetical protein